MHDCLEIFFNLSQEVSFLVNNSLYPVARGCAVVSRPGEVHVGILGESREQEHACIWIDADWSSPVFSFLFCKDFCPLFCFDPTTEKKLRLLLHSLTGGEEVGELERASILFQILSLLEKKQTQGFEGGTVPDTLQAILDDIHKNFSTTSHVSDIQRVHGVSSATLTRWFRRYIHATPREYLESIRLSNALTLLLGGATVTEACMNSGFSDCSHFIVLFKKKFGTTPLKYKKSAQDRPD